MELDDKLLIDLIKRVKYNKITKDSVRFILEMIASRKCQSVDECIDNYKLKKISINELKKEIDLLPKEVIENRGLLISKLRSKLGYSFDVSDLIKILDG